MRKFLLLCLAAILAVSACYYTYYHTSFNFHFNPDAPITSLTGTQGATIVVDQGDGPAPFEIRGVDLGVGKPGHFAGEYAITQEEYLRWFGQIQAMGANTIRIYTINAPAFYEALYQYNRNNSDPLYLIHGLWLNDYNQNSHMDAYDPDLVAPLLEDAKRMVDVVHGRRNVTATAERGGGRFRRDVSPWVLGYILGVEWNDRTVVYTDHMQAGAPPYQGKYFYATLDASPFESLLALLGDTVAGYEGERYQQHRLIAFANWPTTDPLTYDKITTELFMKCAQVDVEHVKTTPAFLSGQFASYHIYPYYPDYLRHSADLTPYLDGTGTANTYLAYLKQIVQHHSMPVVVSEFGVPSSRGCAQIDYGRGFNQGNLTEWEQGEAMAACYRDIMTAGCAGSILFTWQDEWFKRTWNTMHAVDLTQTAYWSDYQTNEQYFGLLSFDPGEEQSICYVDGDDGEWSDVSLVCQNGDYSLSMKYDERSLYFLIRGPIGEGPIYLPIDTTPQSGSTRCTAPAVTFDRAADFLVVLDGADNSRVLVQERYDCLRAMYGHTLTGVDPFEFPPAVDTPNFVPIRLVLQASPIYLSDSNNSLPTYETGALTYGNGNPASPEFNSLTDVCAGDGVLELRLPWQLLNFSNPSDMQIHDDYYLHYGVEDLNIRTLWAGVGNGDNTLALSACSLKGWKNYVTYHERLKQSYYIMQALWAGEGAVP